MCVRVLILIAPDQLYAVSVLIIATRSRRRSRNDLKKIVGGGRWPTKFASNMLALLSEVKFLTTRDDINIKDTDFGAFK